MKYPIIVLLVAALASIPVRALPVRVAPAATDNGQIDPNTLPEIVERNLLPRQGVADGYVASDVREDGSPLIPDPAHVSDATIVQSTSESTSSSAYTAQPTTLGSTANLNATSTFADFIVEAAKAIASTTST